MNQTTVTDDSARLDAIFVPFEEATRFVASNYGKLLKKYPEQWVAVSGHTVLAASPRRDVIRKQLRDSHTERSKVYVTFLTRKKQTLIL